MSAHHTPGPWLFAQAPSDPRMAFVSTQQGRPIADVWNVPHTKGEQALADARLIAAAPELLRELEHAVRWFDQLTSADIARYEAVIAKATKQAKEGGAA